MTITNTTRNTILATGTTVAQGFFGRMKGLLGRDTLSKEEALIIPSCQQVHMFFMKFALDVIFVDKDQAVVGLVKNIKPFRISPLFWRATQAIELPVGVIEATQTQLGDTLTW